MELLLFPSFVFLCWIVYYAKKVWRKLDLMHDLLAIKLIDFVDEQVQKRLQAERSEKASPKDNYSSADFSKIGYATEQDGTNA